MSTRALQDPRTAIAMARRLRRQSQTGLAIALKRESGEPWTRQMVGNLESGRKVLDVDTLALIARIQDLPISFYFEAFENRAKGVWLSSPVSSLVA